MIRKSFPGSPQLVGICESSFTYHKFLYWVLPLNTVLKTSGIYLALEENVWWPRKSSQGDRISYCVHILKLRLVSKKRIGLCLSNGFMLTRLPRNICINKWECHFYFSNCNEKHKNKTYMMLMLTPPICSHCTQVKI